MINPVAFMAVFTVIAMFAFACFVFWVYMIVDCLRKTKFNDKLVWVVVLVFLHIIGALLYYSLVYRGEGKKRRR
jgi:hypothetical protein